MKGGVKFVSPEEQRVTLDLPLKEESQAWGSGKGSPSS